MKHQHGQCAGAGCWKRVERFDESAYVQLNSRRIIMMIMMISNEFLPPPKPMVMMKMMTMMMISNEYSSSTNATSFPLDLLLPLKVKKPIHIS